MPSYGRSYTLAAMEGNPHRCGFCSAAVMFLGCVLISSCPGALLAPSRNSISTSRSGPCSIKDSVTAIALHPDRLLVAVATGKT